MDIERTKERWQELQSILDELFDMPESEWEVHIDRRCGGDKDLRNEVQKLLTAEKSTPTFLDQPAIAASADTQHSEPLDTPFRIDTDEPNQQYAEIKRLTKELEASFAPRDAGEKKFSRSSYWLGLSVAAVLMAMSFVYALTSHFQARQIQQALSRSELEVEKATQLANFLADVFSIADPNQPGVEVVSAQQLLKQDQNHILQNLSDGPEVRGQALATLGTIYFKQGLFEDSRQVLEQALVQIRQIHPENPLALADCLTQLGATYLALNQNPKAKALLEESLRIHRQQGLESVAHAQTVNNYGVVVREQGDLQQAESYFQQAIAMLRNTADEFEPELGTALNNLATLQNNQGQFQQARSNMAQSLEIQKHTLGEQHSVYLLGLINFGTMLTDMEAYDEAGIQLEKALQLQTQVLGAEHKHVAYGLRSLGILNYYLGNFETGKQQLQRALAINQNNVQDQHNSQNADFNTAFIYLWLGTVQQDLGEYDEAAQSYRFMEDIFKMLKVDDPIMGRALTQMASLAHAQGDLDRAANLYLQALQLLPNSGMRTSLAQLGYARTLLDQNQLNLAQEFAQRALQTRFDKLPENHSLVAEAQAILGLVYLQQQKTVQARVLMNSASEVLEQNPIYLRPPRAGLLQLIRLN